MAVNRSGSTLAVDIGNVRTRALLIDLVEGTYQVVAQGETLTTAGFPSGNIATGLRRVITQISAVTGRQLQAQNGRILTPEQPDRSGVDNMLVTASIGRPLRTVLMGLVPEVSIASAMRAVAGTYANVVEVISLDDARDEEAQLNAIVLSRPDLIFMTGGTEGGAREPILQMANTVNTALSLMTTQRPPAILYAGNSALVPQIQAMFDGKAPLFFAPNVRPHLADEDVEAAQLQLALAFNAASSARGAGFEYVAAMSRLGILPTAQSYNLIVDYLGQAAGDTVAVDVGSGVSTFSASIGGRVKTGIHTDIGLGHSAKTLLDTVGTPAVRDWIPFNISDSELHTYALNKTLRPSTVPETLRELYIEYAFLRAAIRMMMRDASGLWDAALIDGVTDPLPPVQRIIGAGAAITHTGRPGLAAMLLLDSLQPQGVTPLYADAGALIPAMGALARVQPAAVVQLLDGTGLERLGVAFSVTGHPRVGRTAMKVKVTVEGRKPVSHEVPGGALWVMPLPLGSNVKVEVRAGRGLSLGDRSSVKMDVEGGSVGLIFDARGRPLPLAVDAKGRAAQMPAWLAQVTGDALRPIDEAWLQPLPKEEEIPAALPAPAAKPERRRRGTDKAERARRDEPQPEPELAPEAQGDDIDELRDLFS